MGLQLTASWRLIDIKALAREMDCAAWVEAARLAAMIQKRGRDRERDLVAALSELPDDG